MVYADTYSNLARKMIINSEEQQITPVQERPIG